MKKRKVSPGLIFIIALAVLICGVVIVQGLQRYTAIERVKREISEKRSEGGPMYLYFVPDGMKTDKKFQGLIVEQVQELCQNKEYFLLCCFLNEMEDEEMYFSSVEEFLSNYINSSGDIADSIELITELGRYGSFDFYTTSLVLNKNNGVLAEYFNAQGVKPITFTEGEGYYADRKNEASSSRVGIEGSNLYNAVNVVYMGDFAKYTRSGVRLNNYYEEESYSSEEYSFRDHSIHFDPTTGECVWAGDYLFLFDSNGNLLDFEEVS